MLKLKGKMVWLVIILIALLAGTGSLTGLRALMSYPAYMTGYQGAHARYFGVRDDSKTYSQGLWDTTFRWQNPTDEGLEKTCLRLPPLAGEMTSVFIPSESVGYQPSWIEPEWLLGASRIKNPVDTYEWQLKDEDETLFYRMELWRLKWYFSISSEPTGDRDIPLYEGVLSTPRNSLKDAEIWFEFDLTPIWYFNGTTRAYFAIASVRLTDIEFGALQGGKDEVTHDSRLRVTPHSKSSILPIYYSAFGESRAEQNVHSYQGKELNPDLFRDKVYSYITLNDFGVSCWWDWGWFWKADVVTMGLDVDVFVIGEWKVKDVQDIPTEYGRTAKTGGEGFGWGAILGSFLGSPEGRFWLLLLMGLGVFVALAIFAPWVLIALTSMLGARKPRKGG